MPIDDPNLESGKENMQNPEQANAPILEFDPARSAILEPRALPLTIETPLGAVLCFFQEVLDELIEAGRLCEVGALRSEIGRHSVFVLEGSPALLVFHPGVGAPLAAGLMEELIALGVQRFIACGSCGVLNPEHEVGAVLLPVSAVRDEGTSYHYLPPAREVNAHPEAVSALQEACSRQGLPYRLVKTWTTDAIYRETSARRALRMHEGCEVVEMEAAAFFAVAQFRNVVFGQALYGGDLVVPEGWDSRAYDSRYSARQRLFWLAVDALREMC